MLSLYRRNLREEQNQILLTNECSLKCEIVALFPTRWATLRDWLMLLFMDRGGVEAHGRRLV